MCKYVVFKVGNGGFLRDGFPVEVRVGKDGQPAYPLSEGQLPPLPELTENYQRWQSSYRSRGLPMRIEPIEEEPTQVSDIESAKALANTLNDWLESDQFRTVKEDLLAELNRSEPIRFVVETKEPFLWQLPWHKWKFFDKYSKAEVAFSPANPGNPIEESATEGGKVRILAIEGDSSGINTRNDRQEIENLADAEAVFLENPKPETICDRLWEEPCDILFFAGHSSSSSDRNTGELKLDPSNSLAIPDIRNALTEAIGKGLKLAIFNSCDGLGLAKNLAELHIPQVIFMREPVPDEFAQKFLKDFLQAFSGGESLYASVQEARKKLELWEKRCPGATWVPVIFQNNPEIAPPTWTELRGSSPEIPEIRKQEIERQEIQRQEIQKQNSRARPRPETQSSRQVLPAQKKVLVGVLGAASLVYFWSLWSLLPFNNEHGSKDSHVAQPKEPAPDLRLFVGWPGQDNNKSSRNSDISRSSASPEMFVPSVPTKLPVGSAASILRPLLEESDFPLPQKYYPLLEPKLSSSSEPLGLNLGGSGFEQKHFEPAVRVSNSSKTPLGLNDRDLSLSFLSGETAATEKLFTALPSPHSRNADSLELPKLEDLLSEVASSPGSANTERAKPVNNIAEAPQGGELAQESLLSEVASPLGSANTEQAKPVNNIAEAPQGGEPAQESLLSEVAEASDSSEPANTEGAGNNSDQAEQAIDSVDTSESVALTSALAQMAGQFVEAGRPEEAAQILAKAEEVAEGINDSSARATALAKIAGKHAEAGDKAQATALLEQARDIAQNNDEPLGQATALTDIAGEYAQVGDRQLATEVLNRAEEMANEVDEFFEKTAVLTAIAGEYAEAGDLSRSVEILDKTQDTAHKIEEPLEKTAVLTAIAGEYAEAGNLSKSAEILANAQETANQINEPLQKTTVLTAIANEHSEAGNLSKSVEILAKAEEMAKEIDEPLEQANILTAIASEYAEAGNQLKAVETIEKALLPARKISDPYQGARTLARVSRAASKAGDRQQANRIVKETLVLAEKIDDPSQQAYALGEAAIAASEAGDDRQTNAVLEKTLTVLPEMSRKSEQVTVSTKLNAASSNLKEQQSASDSQATSNIERKKQQESASDSQEATSDVDNDIVLDNSFRTVVASKSNTTERLKPEHQSNFNIFNSFSKWVKKHFGFDKLSPKLPTLATVDSLSEGLRLIDTETVANLGDDAYSKQCYQNRYFDVMTYFYQAANSYSTQNYNSIFDSIYQSQEFATWWNDYPDAGQHSDCNLPDSVSKTKEMLDCLQGDSCVDITELSNQPKQEKVSVPEPSSTAGIMILGGLGAIATLKRKRKQEK